MTVWAVSYIRAKLIGLRQTCRYARHRVSPCETYSDDGEDVVIAELTGGVRSFLDIGANDGISVSNTALAALRGARGICFEPDPAMFRRLSGFYRFAGRIECVPQGISERAGTLELLCDGLLSYMPATEDRELSQLLSRYRRPEAELIKVPVAPLSDWLARRPDFAGCDLISIDVEGHELSVLRGIDWAAHPKPGRAFVIETHATNEGRLEWRHRDFDEIAGLLGEHGYAKVAASRNNTIWLHKDDILPGRVSAAASRSKGYEWFVR
jgi:FkbM family methyltransferase